MKVLMLGIGLQGKAVVYDLEQSPLITSIIAADIKTEPLIPFLRRIAAQKTELKTVDASSQENVSSLMRQSKPDIVICMLPPELGLTIARAALALKIPFVSSSYTGQLGELDQKARQHHVSILPEMGMDPGIDLVLGKIALDELEEVHGFYSYGGGIPEEDCAQHNPLHYKITWNMDGVLKAYKRPAQLLKDGLQIAIAGQDIFQKQHIHHFQVPGVGNLEAIPNGDALKYIDVYDVGEHLKDIGRFSIRWPGHSHLWRKLVALGFLDDQPRLINGTHISPHQFLVEHLTPRLQFTKDERDMVVIRIMAWGLRDNEPHTVTCDFVDYRDLETGFFAMNRTVGFTASIGAQMILSGKISTTGVLSPAQHVPPDLFFSELAKRNMTFRKSIESGINNSP